MIHGLLYIASFICLYCDCIDVRFDIVSSYLSVAIERYVLIVATFFAFSALPVSSERISFAHCIASFRSSAYAASCVIFCSAHFWAWISVRIFVVSPVFWRRRVRRICLSYHVLS